MAEPRQQGGCPIPHCRAKLQLLLLHGRCHHTGCPGEEVLLLSLGLISRLKRDIERQASRARKETSLWGRPRMQAALLWELFLSPGHRCGDQAPQDSDPEWVFWEESMASCIGDSPMGRPFVEAPVPTLGNPTVHSWCPQIHLSAPFYRVSSFFAYGSCPLKIIWRY